VTFSVKHDLDRLERKLYGFEKTLMKKAAPQALNRTMKTVNSRVVKAISSETNIKQKDVRASLDISKASVRSLRSILNSRRGKARNLIHFVSPSQRNVHTFRKRVKKGFKYPGVKAKAWGKSKVYEGTFIGVGRGGNMRVFRRTSAARLPIESVYGPSPRRMFDSPKIVRVMKIAVAERFPIELNAAINNQIRRMK